MRKLNLMSWKNNSVALLRSFSQSVAILILLSSGLIANGEEKLTRFPPDVVVTPEIAEAGVIRTIKINFQWPTSCIPTFAVIDEELVAPLGILVVRPIGAIDVGVCLSVPTYFRLEVPYTPKQTRGKIRVFLQSPEIPAYGPVFFTIDSPTRKRSPFNITGVYYDPRFSGSGITFVHDQDGTDSVFGTWYVYDSAGRPRWYSIQSTEWKGTDINNNEILEGKLYETTAIPCVANVFVCPVVLNSLKITGTVRISFLRSYIGLGLGQVAKVEAFRPDGSTFFFSDISNILR